jgi:hypothetical protein
VDFCSFGVIVEENPSEGGSYMRRKWMAALVAVAALTFLAGAFQDVLAAEKTMKIKVPGCI